MAFERKINIKTSMTKIADSEYDKDKVVKREDDLDNDLPNKKESCDNGQCKCNCKDKQ
jgi:hypothetical protein